MSSRHARRLATGPVAPSEDDTDDEAAAAPAPAKNAFDLLGGDDSPPDDDSDDEAESAAPTPAPAPEPPAPPAKDKKANKKQRQKVNKKAAAAAATADEADEEEDEDAMLESAARDNAAGVETSRLASVWVVDSRTLDAEAEQKKLFGARAMRAAQAELRAEGRGRGHGAHGGAGSHAPKPRRVLLVAPQATWARPQGLLKQVQLGEAATDGAVSGPTQREYAFEWSQRLQALTQEFWVLQQHSADPNLMIELLRHEPCHVAALLQLQQVAASTGQAEMASDFLERAVFTHEAAFHPTFAAAWLRGEAAMSFAHATNQPFFRAVHKLVVSLSARGCHGAALTAATLLLSLERADDPTRLRLLIDALALRARQPKRLLDLDACYGGSARQLPGWAFSVALAAWQLRTGGGGGGGGAEPAAAAAASAAANGDAESAEALLRRALLTFPAMLPTALQACAASSSSATALSARWREALRVDLAALEAGPRANGSLVHLQALYWERAAPLWSAAETMAWLQAEAAALLDALEGKPPAKAAAAAAAAAAAKPTKPTKAGAPSAAAAVAAACDEALELQRVCRQRAGVWYPAGGADAYRGCEFSSLKDEQVVIPEEEEPAAPPPRQQPPQQQQQQQQDDDEEEDERQRRDEGASASAQPGGDAMLRPLLEEADALTERVAELEGLLGPGKMVPAALRAMVAQRLLTTNERLTQQMIKIDGVDAGDDDALRAAKRELTRRMDALCARTAPLKSPAPAPNPAAADAAARERREREADRARQDAAYQASLLADQQRDELEGADAEG